MFCAPDVRGNLHPRVANPSHELCFAETMLRRVGYFISCTASLLSLAALTIDRFIAITDPLKYRIKLTTERAAMVSLSLWVVSAALPFLYFHVGYLKYQFFFANTAVVATFAVLCLTYAKVFKASNDK
ncbi:hypothetical protein OS493_039656 [Desmophyllum pertusum]|uniref:G-protein coupled receptors family 1 profile domain-containing protein n=1 Tax=Desmophyllum pertusum TaxID=174260 RepID=A0A9W9YH33_9CNID|nr:hypothetical protein OS493_039656 [Desmophyllum pertusum]